MEYAHVSMDTEAIQKLKDEKRALENEKKTKQQQISQLQKDTIQYNTIQEEVAKLTHENQGARGQHLNELREKAETLKPLKELEQEAEELNRKITEDKQLIEDENTSPSERAGRGSSAFRKWKLSWTGLKQRLRCGKRKGPYSKRIKDIFKKYGWTLQAVFVAVGVIPKRVALTVKKGTKVISQKAQ